MVDNVKADEEVVSYLLNDDVFSGVNRRDLAYILPHVVVQQFSELQTIYTAGDAALHLYIVTKGEVKLTYNAGTVKVGKNEKFAMESCTDFKRYVTTATTVTDVTVLKLSRDKMSMLFANNSGIKGKFFFSLLESISCSQDNISLESKDVVTPTKEDEPSKDDKKGEHLKTTGWALVCLFSPIAVWLGYIYGLEVNAFLFLGILTATIGMWVFKLVDEFVPGIFAILSTLCLGISPPEVILSGFVSDGFFMAMSVLGLGTVLITSGLSYRFILLMMLKLPKSQFGLNLGMFSLGVVLTPIIPTANGRVALLGPFLNDIVDTTYLKYGGRAATKLAISTFAGTTMLSGMFITSKSVNFAVLGMMPLQIQENFQWLSWFFSALVTGIITILIYSIVVHFIFKNNETVDISEAQIKKQINLLGRLSFQEWATLMGLSLFLLGILTYSLHKIQPPWLAMSILYGLLIFGTLKKKDFKEKIDWPFLIYLATVVGIISTMKSVGLDTMIANKLSTLFYHMRYNFNLFILILSAIIFILRLAIPINAVIVLVAAVFMPLADLAGINSWILGFIILVLGEMWVFPYQCSYYMQFREVSLKKKIYDERVFLSFNILVNIIKIISIYASLPYWKMSGLL
ncbi:MAG: anion permease [Nitrospirae bacterium]|nr:anion permease [Nitrospirota bacterium]